ncbi:hypothetical protein TNCV_2792221 [Trichonephila clavipes]|nr:hypothetical protein TNCV_2792221 [Trichonephila clavipes]
MWQRHFSKPKLITLKRYCCRCVLKDVRFLLSSAMGIAQYPFKRSNVVMILALPIECMSSTASSIGKSSDTLSEFRALKSTQSRRYHLSC